MTSDCLAAFLSWPQSVKCLSAFCSTDEHPPRHYNWYQKWGWAMPLWYKGNKSAAYPSHHAARPSMDIRRESWLSQQMDDLRRLSRFSPTPPVQQAELRRASQVSQQMAYQHATAGQMRRGSLQDYHPRAYPQSDILPSPYLHLMSPYQADAGRSVSTADQTIPQGRPSDARWYHNQRRNTTIY